MTDQEVALVLAELKLVREQLSKLEDQLDFSDCLEQIRNLLNPESEE